MSPAGARVVDVNLNRLSEALKVIEDVVRFGLASKALLRRVRSLRTDLGKGVMRLRRQVILFRASEKDLGRSDRFDRLPRRNLEDVLLANFKRAEEAARVLEEMMKVTAQRDWAGRFKKIRFRLYRLEKAAVVQGRGKGLDLNGAGSILLAQSRKKG